MFYCWFDDLAWPESARRFNNVTNSVLWRCEVYFDKYVSRLHSYWAFTPTITK